jgi:hypothetical protein
VEDMVKGSKDKEALFFTHSSEQINQASQREFKMESMITNKLEKFLQVKAT